MATGADAHAAAAPAKSEATQFVDALYRKVLMAVKASNGVPSEDDDYHFHTKFSTAFASQADATATRVQELLLRLGRSGKGNTGEGEDGEDEEEDAAPFEGPEPKPRITDLVDTLLDEASRQLEIVARGGNASQQQQYENKPMVFNKKKTDETADARTKEDAKEQAMRARTSRATNKPQDRFDEHIDNSSAPFAPKLRDKVHAISDDGAATHENDEGPTHPYFPEIRALKYADWQVQASSAPYEKIPVEGASYLWVDTDDKLQQMMQSLLSAEARVIAVDLEHHSYRSFLGLVCLMQISTAREDFLVDTLALRGQLQVLNQVFCDPAKVKVLHGSDMDILWLQRDLGLYVVNMFDTGQAARLLNYPRFSLAYLLKRHCGIEADKQYQLADWRVRPLDRNMVKYAREDTRYLLYIYDQMKQELLAASDNSLSNLMLDALLNSSKLCLQVYEKPEASDFDCNALREKLKATVGLPVMSALQLRVFERLFFWRDAVARAEDESHAYVLPNHALIKIAKSVPLRTDQLFRTCHPVPPLVRKHAHEITTMLVAEKAKVAALEAEAADHTVARKEPVVPKKRKFSDHDDETSFTSVKDLSEYGGWVSGKRKARVATAEAADGGRADMEALSLRRSFAECSMDVDHDGDADETLRRVQEVVASKSFVVSEYAVEKPIEMAALASSKPRAAPVADTMPTSLADEYKLSNRTKRVKIEATTVKPKAPSSDAISAVGASAEQTKQRAEGFMQQIGVTAQAKKPLTPFDYATASKQVSGAQFSLEASEAARAAASKRNEHKGGRHNKKTGGRGYNPFVAVRGGKTDGLEEPASAKAPVKKIHQMPRSSTFR
jgi:exosome complex exonuclease RRP6